METMKIYTKEIIGDTETPVTIFNKYVGEEIGILLESREHEKGRYSFIAKLPFRIMKSFRNHYEINGKKIQKGEKKFLELVEEYIKEYEIDKSSKDKIYIGGAYGTIGYDMVREEEKLPDNNPDTIGVPDSHLMFFKKGIVFDHFYQKIIFTVMETNDKLGEESANLKIKEIEKSLNKKLSLNFRDDNNSDEEIIGNTTKEEFIENVKEAQKYIYEGDIFQVVLSQRWEMKTKEKPFNLYRKLRVTNPSPYLFYINFGEYQVAGSSPEMLVEVKEDKIYTCPIAGTRKRGKTPKEDIELAADLLGDEKEKSEHVMLVDLARNDIGRVSKIDSVEVTQFMKVQNYSHVMHLVSLVEGEKREDQTPFSVLSSVLPAGTLSGAPKVRAMEIIDELEKERRGIYGGGIGYFSYGGNMDTCIAIRTMVLKDQKVYMQAGAGITAESIPLNEYQECKNKIEALIVALKS
ncbi:MAG: anthranilate synthase component I [Fusobacteria bacterium]|nr:MAG: anthranilate synthase component I [Fusobacteriota bacterium]